MKLTRRQLAAAIAPATAVLAQQPAAPPDDLAAARDRLKANANALSAVPLPMSTEPATQFRA